MTKQFESNWYRVSGNEWQKRYSMSTNLRLEHIGPASSARDVFIVWTLVEREDGGGASEERRTWLKPTETRNSVRALKKLLTINISSRQLYRHQAKISGHNVTSLLALNFTFSLALNFTFFLPYLSLSHSILPGEVDTYKEKPFYLFILHILTA